MAESIRGASPTIDEYRVGMAWVAGDDTGSSSKALLNAALGIKYRKDYPYDPADLGRCLRLIRLMPFVKERGLPALADRDPVWRLYASHWEELHRMMADEVGIDWEKGNRAPQTYDLMQRLQAIAKNEAA